MAQATYSDDVRKALTACDTLTVAIEAHKARIRRTNDATLWSHAGKALVNAMHEITQCDELYTLAGDIEFDLCGPAPEVNAERVIATERAYYEARV